MITKRKKEIRKHDSGIIYENIDLGQICDIRLVPPDI